LRRWRRYLSATAGPAAIAIWQATAHITFGHLRETSMTKPSERRPEPEIIPPGVPLHRASGAWPSGDVRGRRYVYTTRVGPIGFALTTLAIGGIAVLGLLFLLGAAVIGLITVGVLVGIGFIAGLLRKPNQPLR
jgi:hypothetical protein